MQCERLPDALLSALGSGAESEPPFTDQEVAELVIKLGLEMEDENYVIEPMGKWPDQRFVQFRKRRGYSPQRPEFEERIVWADWSGLSWTHRWHLKMLLLEFYAVACPTVIHKASRRRGWFF